MIMAKPVQCITSYNFCHGYPCGITCFLVQPPLVFLTKVTMCKENLYSHQQSLTNHTLMSLYVDFPFPCYS